MKFGLFGGAVIKSNADSGDSLGYRPFMDVVSKAEELGFESMSLVEHHFGGDGQISSSLSLLSHLTAITSKLRLGTAVTVLPWHNPVLLAEQVATIDVLSGGRVDFGVGKGYRKNEYKGFNIPQDEALARYLESIEIIKKAWTSRERFSFKGKFWSFEDIIVEPSPVQVPHPPLWSAAGSDESIRDVAKAGFKVLFDHFATFERTQQRLDAWREACNKIGRTFDPNEVCLARGLTITTSDKEYEEAIERREVRVTKMIERFGSLPGIENKRPNSYSDKGPEMDESALIGDPDTIVLRIKTLEKMGFEYLNILLPDDSKSLNLFANEVMPEFTTKTQESLPSKQPAMMAE